MDTGTRTQKSWKNLTKRAPSPVPGNPEENLTNIRQRVREPSEKVKLTTAQSPPQRASGAPRRGRSARGRYPTKNQPTTVQPKSPRNLGRKFMNPCMKKKRNPCMNLCAVYCVPVESLYDFTAYQWNPYIDPPTPREKMWRN